MVGRAVRIALALAAVASAAKVEELRFVTDAKALAAAAGGVVVVGLFGDGDAAEKKGFMAAAKSAEFEDEGWAVAWSGAPTVVESFRVATPAMLVYRLFDANGEPCDPKVEAYDA